jgi:hypothetical protein
VLQLFHSVKVDTGGYDCGTVNKSSGHKPHESSL